MHYLDKFKFCPVCGSSNFEINGFKSKLCADCNFELFFNSAAAAVCIIENERGELLMCRRACEPHKGTLDLVGGFVDPGESLERAICREIEEEIGLTLEENDLKLLFSLPNTYCYSGLLIHTTDAFFHTKISSDTMLTPTDDVAECMWMRPEEINLADIALDSIRLGTERWINRNE